MLLVPGGYGQQALMHDEEVLQLIRKHDVSERRLFSVCTGTQLCPAAGVLNGKTSNNSLECSAPDAALRSCSCGCKGGGGPQRHQSRWRDG